MLKRKTSWKTKESLWKFSGNPRENSKNSIYDFRLTARHDLFSWIAFETFFVLHKMKESNSSNFFTITQKACSKGTKIQRIIIVVLVLYGIATLFHVNVNFYYLNFDH